MTLSSREKILLFVLGIILIVFLGVQFLITPLYKNFMKDGTALLQNEMTRQDVLLKVNGAQRMLENSSKSLKEADTAAQALLPSLDNDQLDLWLSGFASGAGLNTVSITFTAPVSTDISTGFGNTQSGQQAAGTNQTTVTVPSYKLKTFADGYKSGSGVPSNSSSAQSSSKAKGSSSAAPAQAAIGSVLGEQVTITANGSYSQITAFIDKIQSSGKAVRFSALSCKPSGTSYQMIATLDCFAAEKLDNSDSTFNWNLPAPAGQGSLICLPFLRESRSK